MGIVIVDDNSTNLLIIEQMLSKAGYQDVVKASSALELFEYLKIGDEAPSDYGIDLILMDLMMPVIDGIQATRRIQQVESLRDIPIIIVTALGDSQKLAEALDAGAIDFVMKPVNRIELLARMRVALRLKYEKDWHKEQEQKTHAKLLLARQVQTSILSKPVEDEKIKIGAAYRPSSELAGDLYTWHKINDNQYGIILLDVMGHGVSASLVCMYMASVLKETIINYIDPIEVIRDLNRRMNQLDIKDPLVNYFFTAIYLLIDTERKVVEYVNAGHPPGLMNADGQLITMNQGCCAVGLFPEISIHKGMINYEMEAKLLLYTDGLMDILQIDSEEGMQRITEIWMTHSEIEPDQLFEHFMFNVDYESHKDDICLIMLQLQVSKDQGQGNDKSVNIEIGEIVNDVEQ